MPACTGGYPPGREDLLPGSRRSSELHAVRPSRSREDMTDICVDTVAWVEVLAGLDELLKFRGEGGEFALTGPDVVELSVKEE